jgi:hypothetical protein
MIISRRTLVSMAPAAYVAASEPEAPLTIALNHVLDLRAKLRPEQLHRFRSYIWPEAVRDFEHCGIRLQTTFKTGEIRRSPSGAPLFTGLDYGVVNFVITGRIPMEWDGGRNLRGLTTIYHGYHLCMIALEFAHGHRLPFLAVNTCVHELLHVFLHDIFESRPKGAVGAARELRIDMYATQLWLFRDGGAIRKAAAAYARRVRSGLTARA